MFVLPLLTLVFRLSSDQTCGHGADLAPEYFGHQAGFILLQSETEALEESMIAAQMLIYCGCNVTAVAFHILKLPHLHYRLCPSLLVEASLSPRVCGRSALRSGPSCRSGRRGFGVHLHVVGEVRGAAEALAAELTLESNPRVLPLVAAHRAGEGEALAAGAACVGSLPAVGPLVLLQVHLLCEALLAGGALEGFLPGVDP